MCVARMTHICRDNAGEVNEPECGHAFAWRSRRKNWRGPARAKCRNRSFSAGTAISRPLLAAAAIKIRCGFVKYSFRCHMYPTQPFDDRALAVDRPRSEEHTSELQSLMRISYAVFCLKK